jgi:hypothetical protein
MGKVNQTAVEWLIKQLYTYGLVDKNIHPNNLIFQKAKEMEKQQHEETALSIAEILLDKLEGKNSLPSKELFEQYYTETYGK